MTQPSTPEWSRPDAHSLQTKLARYLGKFLSHALNPVVVNVPALAVASIATGLAGWGESLLLVFISTVLPAIYTVALLRMGVFSNIFVSNRRERIYFLPAILFVISFSLWLCRAYDLSIVYWHYFLISTANMVFASVLTIWYKVSLHLYGIAGLSVYFVWLWGLDAAWTLWAIPLCAAGRLLLREHTAGQVILGAALGLVLTPLMLLLTVQP